MKTRKIEIDPDHPQPHLLREGVDVLFKGGIIAFPTDTSYGLGVNPFDDEAVEKLYKTKRRDAEKPLILFINDKKQIHDLVAGVPAVASALMEKCWPGPLTLIFKSSSELLSFKIGESNKIGVRIPDAVIAQKLLELAKIPVTATSANISGQPSSLSADEVLEYFADDIEIIFDGGKALAKGESTVIDVTVSPPKLIREGVVSVVELKTLIGKLQ